MVDWGDIPGWLTSGFTAITAGLVAVQIMRPMPVAHGEWLADDEIRVTAAAEARCRPWRVTGLVVNGKTTVADEFGRELLIPPGGRESLLFKVPAAANRLSGPWPTQARLKLRCGRLRWFIDVSF